MIDARALKFAVIGMGILIVLGLAVIFVTIAKRMTAGKGPDVAAVADVAPQRPPAPFGNALVSIPRGSRMVDFRVEGGRILVHVRPPGLEDVIHVLDLETARVLGTVTVAPRPK